MESNIVNCIKKTKNKFNSFLDEYKKEKFEVVLYGAGRGSYWAIKLLGKYDIKPKFIIDKNEEKQGEEQYGIPIVSLQYVLREFIDKQFRIIVASPKFEKEIIEDLSKNISTDKIYSFECELYYSFIFDIDEYKNYLIDNLEELKNLYMNLEDDFSRKTLKAVICGRLSGDLHYFNDVCVPNQYFSKDIVKLSQQEVIVDVGANNGDTLQHIVDITSGKFKHIYCLEPDKECLIELNKTKEQLGFKNVSIIDKGAWDTTTKLTFSSNANQGASKIIENANKVSCEESLYTIETTTLDSIINEDVTFIKMDIEGAELNALKGAQNIIKKYSPKLAICVYHKNEDFTEIYEYIKNLNPNYKFYLRHHNVSGTETVMYALP